MAKQSYSQDVHVDIIKFDSGEKKRLQKGDIAFGESIKMQGSGNDAVFFKNVSVNGNMERVEEGMAIVSFDNGSQKLLSADEVKKQGFEATVATANSKAVKDAAKASRDESDLNQKSLAERAAENDNSLGAQSDQDARERSETSLAAKIEAQTQE